MTASWKTQGAAPNDSKHSLTATSHFTIATINAHDPHYKTLQKKKASVSGEVLDRLPRL
jgi:hypothetical protein